VVLLVEQYIARGHRGSARGSAGAVQGAVRGGTGAVHFCVTGTEHIPQRVSYVVVRMPFLTFACVTTLTQGRKRKEGNDHSI
jgi:hypothetical protein